MSDKTHIYVYAHWKGMNDPRLIGLFISQQAKGKRAYNFSYDKDWISSTEQLLLDPDISWFGGTQYPVDKENFGVFMDSMPDSWGRTLMKRKAIFKSKVTGSPVRNLYETDFLLGVHDQCRMGALRFKLQPDGPFLDNDPVSPAPPWTTISELQYAAELTELNIDSLEAIKWLKVLLAPGSSLGGARPKANITDEHGHLWIAKFPSKNDRWDYAAWEYLVYRLAVLAGIEMAESKLEHVSGNFHTFFTKRFDRELSERIHFASAITMTGKNETIVRDQTPSYLDIAEFIQFSGCQVEQDLKQLWRRIVFNVLISNTDDHLRNHGFILTVKGWRLSPAFDVNPSVDKQGHAINIDLENNSPDLELVKSVGIFFRINKREMDEIIREVKLVVSKWQLIASEIGISRMEQKQMEAAFRI